jgi:hypothetical protein
VQATKLWGMTVAAIACCVTLAGCNAAPPPQDKADYQQTLNKYFQGRPVCIWPDEVSFPIADASSHQIDARGLDALTDAGLLVRKPAAKGAPAGSYSYDLSPEGRSALDASVELKDTGNFCFGRRKVLTIDGARENSTSTEVVDFHYIVAQPASWATENSIESAFPQVANELSGPHKAEVTLLDTTDGWEVSGTPATIVPLTATPRQSTLAKAKALLHLKKRQSS